MAFIIKPTKWLEVEANRVEAIITMKKYEAKKWEIDKLKEELENIGLQYSTAQLTEIYTELKTRKVVVDI